MTLNGQIFKDSNNNEIHAHGGWILQFGGEYFWYGEDRRGNNYVSCYKSRDLKRWEFCSHSLTIDSPCVTEQLTICGKKVNIERPKVIYNEKTKTFVMWAHYENGTDYLVAACAVAVSSSPNGEFTYLGHFRPCGNMSRDCTLFVDDDKTAYFLSASNDNLDMVTYKLSDDYLRIEKIVNKSFIGLEREAPAVFKHNGKYYMISSFCTGWKPNQCKYAVSDRIDGEWSELKNIGDETTYHSQPAFVFPYKGKFLYFGDRWGGDGWKTKAEFNYFRSGYLVLELRFENKELNLIWSDIPLTMMD